MKIDLKHIQSLNAKEKIKYLIRNKKSLIAQKKSMPINSDVCYFSNSLVKTNTVKNNDIDNKDSIRVKTVANTANFIDSQMDLLLPDAWQKSISERKHLIPHLHDHEHTVDAKIGEVVDIFSSNISLKELGINKEGTTQSLIFITDIEKSYNEKIFNQYKKGKVNQHSIGLQYIQLDLAVNNEDEKKEFELWNKHYNQIINKELADKEGYFWVVKEIKLLENSAVLFGANELTPTLSNDKIQSQLNEPLTDTQEQNKEPQNALNINYLINNI